MRGVCRPARSHSSRGDCSNQLWAPTESFLAVILCLSAAVVAAFLLVAPQRAFVLRLVVVLNFLFITLFVLAANSVVAEKAAARWVAPEPTWIDEAVEPNARVVGVWAESQDGSPTTQKVWDRWSALFEGQLMNDSVARLYAFGRACLRLR